MFLVVKTMGRGIVRKKTIPREIVFSVEKPIKDLLNNF